MAVISGISEIHDSKVHKRSTYLKIMSILGRFMDEILFDICRRRRMKIQKQKIQSTAQNNLSKVWFLSYIILLILFLILYIATVDCEKIAKSIVCYSIVDC